MFIGHCPGLHPGADILTLKPLHQMSFLVSPSMANGWNLLDFVAFGVQTLDSPKIEADLK